MKRHFALSLAAAAAVLLASCMTVAVPPGSKGGPSPDRVLLGERVVAFKADHDVIQVRRYEGNFRSLVVVVEKNDIELYNVVVVYGNGERDKFKTRYVFRGGSRSRDLQFEGGQRRIRAIEFTYKTVGDWQDGRARVLVYGVR
jgi:hypothetical protein